MGSTRSVRLDWTGGARFRGRGTDPPGPTVDIDGDNRQGTSPMQLLLLAAAGCSGIDIVSILEKMRVTVSSLSIDIVGERVEDVPQKYRSISFVVSVSGDGVDRSKVERAVQLSVEKYCSVLHTLSPEVRVGYEIEIS